MANPCFSCAHVVECCPIKRPCKRAECKNFKDFGYKPLTQEQIAEHLQLERHRLSWILKMYGVTPVIELLKTRERYVRFEAFGSNIHFYELKI